MVGMITCHRRPGPPTFLMNVEKLGEPGDEAKIWQCIIKYIAYNVGISLIGQTLMWREGLVYLHHEFVNTTQLLLFM